MNIQALMISALLAVAVCTPLGAQDTTSLPEVAVTALRRLKDTGIQRTALDTTVLHENIASSMSDILTQHTPLFIKSYGRATESTAEFRGTSPSHTQVLWNGLKINSPMLGTVDFSTIPAYFVDQAHLLHGASSLTVTGGGLGGAVELTTTPPPGQGWGLQYIQGVGSFSTFDQFLRATCSSAHWSSSTRVVYSTSKNNFSYTNYDKKTDERDASGNIIRSYHPTERNRSGYFDDVHALQELYYTDPCGNRFGAQAWYTFSLRGLPFLSVDYRDDADFRNEQKQHVLRSCISWDRTCGRWSFNAKGGYTYQDLAYDYSTTHNSFSSDITHSQTYSQQGHLRLSSDFMPTPRWLLSGNVTLRYNHVRSHDKSPFHIGDNYSQGRMEFEAAISARYRPAKRLTISALLREESYGHDLVPLIPAAFAEYQLINKASSRDSRRSILLLAKASVARNYRYPTMDDLYFQPGGNPELRPERGFTYDGGLEFRYRSRRFTAEANLSAFDSYITDWILWLPNAKGYWQPSNLKSVHSYGTELSATAQFTLQGGWQLSLTANYAYTPSLNRSDALSASDASWGRQLPYIPRHSANLCARILWHSWTLSAQWHSYSERYTTTSNEVGHITGRLKPYYMSNIALGKQFRLRYLHATLKGVVNNLLGSEYVTVLSRPMPGRNFEIFLELKPQWKRK